MTNPAPLSNQQARVLAYAVRHGGYVSLHPGIRRTLEALSERGWADLDRREGGRVWGASINAAGRYALYCWWQGKRPDAPAHAPTPDGAALSNEELDQIDRVTWGKS